MAFKKAFRKLESRCRKNLDQEKLNNPYLVDQHLLRNKPKITINGKEIEFV